VVLTGAGYVLRGMVKSRGRLPYAVCLYVVRVLNREASLAAFQNPSLDEIGDLLGRVKNIAVVGFSPRPGRASHNIARQLQRFGFRIIPVRPGIAQGLGEKAYSSLSLVPDRIDLVNVFRTPGEVPAIVDQCLRLGLKVLWLQEGAANEEAAVKARKAGMTVIMDRCIMRDYTRLCLS